MCSWPGSGSAPARSPDSRLPGWYADPWELAPLRWWDGSAADPPVTALCRSENRRHPEIRAGQGHQYHEARPVERRRVPPTPDRGHSVRMSILNRTLWADSRSTTPVAEG